MAHFKVLESIQLGGIFPVMLGNGAISLMYLCLDTICASLTALSEQRHSDTSNPAPRGCLYLWVKILFLQRAITLWENQRQMAAPS